MSAAMESEAAFDAAVRAYAAYVAACAASTEDSKDFYGATVKGRSFKDFLETAFEFVSE